MVRNIPYLCSPADPAPISPPPPPAVLFSNGSLGFFSALFPERGSSVVVGLQFPSIHFSCQQTLPLAIRCRRRSPTAASDSASGIQSPLLPIRCRLRLSPSVSA